MKKVLFLVVVMLLAVEFRAHPILKPYTDRLVSLVSTQAKKSLGVSDFPKFIEDLEKLSAVIAPHEYNYLIDELTDFSKVKIFNQNQCGNINLSHMTLTGYSIKKTCKIIEEYLPSS